MKFRFPSPFYIKMLKFNKTILKNFSYLTLIQIITLLVPFIYYPYIIRKFSIDDYGLVIFIQSIVSLFSIIIDFGFNIYATRLVAENRNNKEQLNIIYSSVFCIKTVLFSVCFMFYFIFILYNEKLHSHLVLSVLLYLLVIGEAFFSQWLYLGLEKVRISALINLSSKIMLLIIIFIGSNSFLGFYSFPIGLVSASIINAILSTIIIRKIFNIKLIKVPISEMWQHATGSYSFLLSRAMSAIIIKLNAYLIGNYIGFAQVAYYDLAERLMNLALIPINTLNQVIYPHVARTRNFNITTRAILFSLPIYIIFYPILYFFGEDFIIIFAGSELIESFNYLIVLYLIPIINIIVYFTGNCALILINKKKEFNNSIYVSFIIYVLSIFILLISNNLTIYKLCWILVMNSLIICLYRLYYSIKYIKLFL
ncbi:oligosaccharide flippase family protein [Xenorhabdus bovienii]|uniref:oligosaccharide flippase family protein n=1 Tax=Xenorhabdus bovienii TaxID=40576 RepID=UPI0009E2142E|nr:oligosaccharide flippase family protein [Xenorhabdus bovienii]